MADSRGQPVKPVWTCEQLSATNIPGKHRYYGRCGLGDALGRSRWLNVARDHHLLDLRRLRVDFWSEAEAQLSELIAAKAAVLSSDSRPEPSRRLQAAVTALLDVLDAFAGRNSDRFAAAGIDPGKLRHCVQTTLNDILQSTAAEVLRPPSSLIAAYPLAVQAFLRPDLVAASLAVSASGR